MSGDSDHIKTLMRRAVDQAFQQHIGKLYSVWVTDPNENQPQRAAKGATNAIEIYRQAIKAIDRLKI